MLPPPHRLSLINNPLSPMIAILNPPLRLLMSICGRFYAGTYSISHPFFSRPAAFTLPRAATMYTTLDERLLPGLNTLPKHQYIATHNESTEDECPTVFGLISSCGDTGLSHLFYSTTSAI